MFLILVGGFYPFFNNFVYPATFLTILDCLPAYCISVWIVVEKATNPSI